MAIRKWFMKQYWRLIQVRGIWNLFYGVLLLAGSYYIFIPMFYDMGALGPFIFAGGILVVFLLIGYLYDKIFVMWGPQQEVVVERNPYSYVPQPRDRIFWFPVYSSILSACNDIAEALDLDTTTIEATRKYFSTLETFRPERTNDIDKAEDLKKKFISEHPFKHSPNIFEDE
ncbi:MAG: hypothetical protein ACTSV2_06725 [Candidatus Thorarchaeota archaeon]